jgi:hypothetical protein
VKHGAHHDEEMPDGVSKWYNTVTLEEHYTDNEGYAA